jgi:two-component system, chemotaxis family, protein-glutamate methylesterase/glutaminase
MIRVFIVDDSAIVRKKLTDDLNKYPDIQVVGSAIDPYVARDKIVRLNPDVITLDVEMPRMDGITFLKKIMRFFPKPVIIISSLTKQGSDLAMVALESGAVEVLCKPGGSYSVGDLTLQLARVIRAAAKANMKNKQLFEPSLIPVRPPEISTPLHSGGLKHTTDKIIAMGASTGGTEALKQVLMGLPADSPGIVIVQHMPPKFTTAFAERLNSLVPLDVKEAEDGDRVLMGRVLIAPGNFHMLLKKSGADYFVQVKEGPMVHHHRPSVDVLFHSVAQVAGNNAVGVMLTGMGGDGSIGMKEMHDKGAFNIAQNEESCVVYGMPKEAVKLGAVDQILHLNDISTAVIEAIRALHARS